MPFHLFPILAAWLTMLLVARSSGAVVDDAQRRRGQELYLQHCLICHQATGEGASGIFPPLAKSDFLMADKRRSIRILCEGLQQPITVNGQLYYNTMAPMPLDESHRWRAGAVGPHP